VPTFFLNGKFYGEGDPSPMVSALDAGLQHGVGLFETLLGGNRLPQGKPWVLHLDEHLDRLAASARALNLSDQLRTSALGDVVLETVGRSGLDRARIRLTVTGGDLNLLARSRDAGGAAKPHDPTVLIVAQPATSYPRPMLAHGVAASIADARISPLDAFAGHKTLGYWWRLRELQVASGKNAAEALVFSVSNHLVSGCVSNAFLVKGGELFTPIARGEEMEVAKEGEGAAARSGPQGAGPVLPSPVLPGVTRKWVVETAASRGMVTRRRMLAIADVLSADEVFLTNSSWGVLPVVKLEAETIGRGKPGPVAVDLIAAWDRSVREAAELA
jgi:branched-chain amino acid aminotransferase